MCDNVVAGGYRMRDKNPRRLILLLRNTSLLSIMDIK